MSGVLEKNIKAFSIKNNRQMWLIIYQIHVREEADILQEKEQSQFVLIPANSSHCIRSFSSTRERFWIRRERGFLVGLSPWLHNTEVFLTCHRMSERLAWTGHEAITVANSLQLSTSQILLPSKASWKNLSFFAIAQIHILQSEKNDGKVKSAH